MFYCVIASVCADAQHKESDIITKRLLSVEDGMAAREVFCTVQDKDGFMWFGTSNGLNRYDGKTFTLFNTANTGLSSNYIYQLAIDDQNNLIIIYNITEQESAAGLYKRMQVLDLKSYQLKNLPEVYKNVAFDLNKIYWIANDETNDLNIMTTEPITWWKYNTAKGFEKRYEFKKLQNESKSKPINYLSSGYKSFFSHDKALLAFHNKGNYIVSKDTAIFFRYRPADNISGFDEKLGNKVYDNYATFNTLMKGNGGLQDNSYSGNKNIPFSDFLYIATINDSSNLLYKQNNGIFLFKNNKLQSLYSAVELMDLFDVAVFKNYIDRIGNRWICTSAGVLEVTIKHNFFKHYFKHVSRKLSTNSSQIRGMHIEQGINNDTTVYALESSDVLVRQKGKDGLVKGHGGVYYAMLYEKDSIYIGGYNLLKYKPVDGTIVSMDSIPIQETWSLYRFSDHVILSGRIKGIYSYDEQLGKTIELAYISTNIPRVKNVYKIMRTTQKGLIAVAENGIYVIDNRLRIVDYYGKQTTDKSKYIPIDTIYDVLEDKLGVCWIATGGAGLYKWRWNEQLDGGSKKIQQFSLIDGLPSTILYRIEQDDDGYLWTGTYNGLVRFDTRTNTSIVFTTKDGLTANEFNRISSFKSSNGGLYFGSMNGISAFLPKTINREIDSLIIPFRLIELTKFSAANNELKDCLKEFNLTHKMVLEVGDKFVSFAFALLDYQQRIHHYAYKIEGFDKGWIYLEEATLRISGLPAGDYTVRIKAKLENGQWDKNEIAIPIKVLKAFYFQWWFITATVLIMILLFVLFFYYRTRKLTADKLLLENAVLDRTRELQNRTVELHINAFELQKALGDKSLLLAEVHHRVKNNLQVISGLLHLQSITMHDEKLTIALQEGQSRVNSIALIHENVYQHDTIGTVCFHQFVKELVGQVAELFEHNTQIIRFEIGEEEIFLDIDTAVPLGLIVNELVTNAYKYLPKNKKPNIVSIKVNKLTGDEYTMVYRDNGPGIAGGIDFKTANSLGLRLIKRLSNQLLGDVAYRYNEGAEISILFKIKCAK